MKHKLLIVFLASFLFIGGGYWYMRHQGHNDVKDALRGEQIKQLNDHATVSRRAFDSVSYRLDSMSRLAVHGLSHWDTVTVKVAKIVTLPGKDGEVITRVDSVYKDAAFAALPDSDKVKLLKTLGDENVKVCRALISTCQAARDSAKSIFVQKDNIIHLWEQRYEDKPRRKCGIGFTLGIVGGVSSTLSPISGVGGAAGFSCTL